jgi:hypothetical protein
MTHRGQVTSPCNYQHTQKMALSPCLATSFWGEGMVSQSPKLPCLTTPNSIDKLLAGRQQRKPERQKPKQPRNQTRQNRSPEKRTRAANKIACQLVVYWEKKSAQPMWFGCFPLFGRRLCFKKLGKIIIIKIKVKRDEAYFERTD